MKPPVRAALVATVIVAAGCSPSKTDLATVNGQQITKDQLTAQMMQGPEAKAAMRTLIQQSLLENAAKKLNITVSDADVTQYLQARKDQLPPNRFEEVTTAAGATDARMRQDARTELLRRGLEMQGAKISDESIKKIYDADAGHVFTKPEWVQVGYIVTKDKADADNAISALKQGVDFPIVAGKFTIPEAKQQAAQLQWFGIVGGTLTNEQRQPLQGVEPAVRDAILKTSAGKTSAPIGMKGRPFQRIIYIKTRMPGSKLPLEEVKGDIAYGIAMQNNQIKPNILEDLVKDAKIDIKADQFKDLGTPEGLLPRQPMNSPRQ